MFAVSRYARTWSSLCVLVLLMLSTLGTVRPVAAETATYGAEVSSPATRAALPTKADLKARFGDCLNAASTNARPAITATPVYVTTITAVGGAKKTPISDGDAIVADKFPYKVTYTVTFTNTGGDMTAGVSANIGTFTGVGIFKGKTRAVKIPVLKSGASKAFTFTLSYTSATIPYVYASMDSSCQTNADHADAFDTFAFYVQSSNVDMIPDNIGVSVVGGQVGNGVNAGDKVNVNFSIVNLGVKNPTQPMTVVLKSPLFSTPVSITIAAADLPAAGSSEGYVITQSGATAEFTVKAKPTTIPITLTINTTKSLTEDNYKNNTYIRKLYVYPEGINLAGYVSFARSCPQPTGNATFKIYVYNSGTQDAGAFTVQLLVDGKPAGTPQAISGLAAGKSTSVNVDFAITKQGFHKLGVFVDNGRSVAEYNEKDNVNKGYNIFFLAPTV